MHPLEISKFGKIFNKGLLLVEIRGSDTNNNCYKDSS